MDLSAENWGGGKGKKYTDRSSLKKCNKSHQINKLKCFTYSKIVNIWFVLFC